MYELFDFFTADAEEPNCMRCDHVTTASEEFCKECGECFWMHYIRRERKELEDTHKKEDVLV